MKKRCLYSGFNGWSYAERFKVCFKRYKIKVGDYIDCCDFGLFGYVEESDSFERIDRSKFFDENKIVKS